MKTLLSWSGGKDSSLALNAISKMEDVEIAGLLTTVTADYDRISMHGVRRSLLRQQALSAGLPLFEVPIPKNATNDVYEREIKVALIKLKKELGISTVVFGDLFLEDIREYREKLLSGPGLNCLFPLWRRDTRELAEYFITSGFRAVLCTIDPKKLDSSFCGREFDRSFLTEIPENVDPCGENGEFHTFVFDGPVFQQPIGIKIGEVVEREGFYFADLLPLEKS